MSLSKASIVIRKVRNLIANVRSNGMASTARLYRYRAYEYYREWLLGVKTSGEISQIALGHGVDCMQYQAVNYRCLDNLFSFLQVDPARDVFLDYGCGKGRAVVSAAMHPFRRVTGIELSSDLANQAGENLDRLQVKKRSNEEEILCCDATQYKPPADVNVVFLFNPFRGEVLKKVQNQLLKSLISAPRDVTIIYMRPVAAPDLFADCDWLNHNCDLPTADWHDVHMHVYTASKEFFEDLAADYSGHVQFQTKRSGTRQLAAIG